MTRSEEYWADWTKINVANKFETESRRHVLSFLFWYFSHHTRCRGPETSTCSQTLARARLNLKGDSKLLSTRQVTLSNTKKFYRLQNDDNHQRNLITTPWLIVKTTQSYWAAEWILIYISNLSLSWRDMWHPYILVFQPSSQHQLAGSRNQYNFGSSSPEPQRRQQPSQYQAGLKFMHIQRTLFWTSKCW